MDTQGAGVAVAWLVALLMDINEFCGVRDKMSERQMNDLANIIRTEYGYLTAAELMLFAQRLKSGRYGQFYGTIDPQTILIALRQRFMSERWDELEMQEQRELERQREEWAKESVSEKEFGRKMDDIMQRLKASTNKDKRLNAKFGEHPLYKTCAIVDSRYKVSTGKLFIESAKVLDALLESKDLQKMWETEMAQFNGRGNGMKMCGVVFLVVASVFCTRSRYINTNDVSYKIFDLLSKEKVFDNTESDAIIKILSTYAAELKEWFDCYGGELTQQINQL